MPSKNFATNSFPHWVMQLSVATLYLLLGLLVHQLVVHDGVISIFWPGSGLALAAVLLGGRRYLWGVALGSLFLNAVSLESLWAITGLTLANVFEAQFGAWLLSRYGRPERFMGALSDYLRLIALGGGVASVLGSLLASFALLMAGDIVSSYFWETAIHWWMGATLGVAIVTPIVLAWARNRSTQLTVKQKVEAILLISFTFIAGQFVFLDWSFVDVADIPKGYLMFLFVTWVAIRLGVRGTTFVLLIIAVQALLSALLGVGRFAYDIEQTGLHSYWAYMLVLSITGMAIATHSRALHLSLKALQLKDEALNAAANGIVITDIDGKIEWANRSFCSATGYSLAEAAGKNPRDLVKSGKQSSAFYKQMWDTILSKQVWRGELINRRKDGSIHDEELTITPVINETDEITHFVAVKLDISNRVKADRRIAYSEALFHGLFENMNSGVAIYEAVDGGNDFVIKDINRAVEKLEKVNRKDLLGKRLTLVFPGVKECGLFAFLQRVYQTGEPADCPVMFYHDNRITGWRENRIYRLPSGELVAIYEDVSERKRAEMALQDSHEKISALLNSMAEGAYGVDPKGNCTFVNNAFLHILGYEYADEVVGQHIHELIHHSHADGSPYPATECRMYAAYRNNEKIHCDAEVFWKKDNTTVPVEYWSQPIIHEGEMRGAIATFIDITERKEVEEKLRYSEQRFHDVNEAAGEYVWEIDTNMVYTYVSARSVDVKGYTPEELLGHTPMEFMHEDDLSVVGEIVSRAIANTPFKLEHRNITKTGAVVWEEVSGVPFCNKNGDVVGLRGTGLSITDRKEREDQIHRMAFYDPLTKLPNRRLLNERLAHTLISSKRSEKYGALMFLDLDNFKPLNDIHGHVVGDLLLIEVANRLKNSVRDMDCVARFGGDEFVVMLSELDADKAAATALAKDIAEKIRTNLAEPYLLTVAYEDKEDVVVEHRCSASIGVTVFTHTDGEQTNIMKWADEAMYQAKAAGRNSIWFHES